MKGVASSSPNNAHHNKKMPLFGKKSDKSKKKDGAFIVCRSVF